MELQQRKVNFSQRENKKKKKRKKILTGKATHSKIVDLNPTI